MLTTTLLIISLLADVGLGGKALQHTNKLEKMLVELEKKIDAIKTE